jgi:hypothetical protein
MTNCETYRMPASGYECIDGVWRNLGGLELAYSDEYSDPTEFADVFSPDEIALLERAREEAERYWEGLDAFTAQYAESLDAEQREVFRDLVERCREDRSRTPLVREMREIFRVRTPDSLLLLHNIADGNPVILMATGAARLPGKQKLPEKPSRGENIKVSDKKLSSEQQKYQNELILWSLDAAGELVIAVLGVLGLRGDAGKVAEFAKKLMKNKKIAALIAAFFAKATWDKLWEVLKAMYDEGLFGELLRDVVEMGLAAVAWFLLNLFAAGATGGGKYVVAGGIAAVELGYKLYKMPKKPT